MRRCRPERRPTRSSECAKPRSKRRSLGSQRARDLLERAGAARRARGCGERGAERAPAAAARGGSPHGGPARPTRPLSGAAAGAARRRERALACGGSDLARRDQGRRRRAAAGGAGAARARSGCGAAPGRRQGRGAPARATRAGGRGRSLAPASPKLTLAKAGRYCRRHAHAPDPRRRRFPGRRRLRVRSDDRARAGEAQTVEQRDRAPVHPERRRRPRQRLLVRHPGRAHRRRRAADHGRSEEDAQADDSPVSHLHHRGRSGALRRARRR